MTTQDEPVLRPSLRIAELAITNFRTFRGRTVLPFGSPRGGADPIVTLHGDNGAGKSNAVAALDQFFLALTFCLSGSAEAVVSWDAPLAISADRFLVLSSRDRPAGADGPTDIEVRFEDARLGTFRVRYIPAGKGVRLLAEHRPGAPSSEGEGAVYKTVSEEQQDQLLTWIQTPLGPSSHPFAVLDERRRPTWLPRTEQRSLLHPALAEQLLAIRTDLDPAARQRWRAFGESLRSFPPFQGKIFEIQRSRDPGPPELVVEEPGKSVLRLDELSSGEQQLIVLYASVLFAGTPVVALLEPELSLDEKNQQLFSDLLTGLVRSGQVDQILLESHVPAFDGERVLRFRRSAAGATEVERAPSAAPKSQELRERARQQGAEQCWVTRDGYTQIPDIMRSDLNVGSGASVWFLKNHGRWGAWPEQELEELFSPGDPEGTGDE